VSDFDEGTWLRLSDAASTLDSLRRRAAMATGGDIAQAHDRGHLMDHAVGEIRRAALHNRAMAVVPDPETMLEILACATSAMIVGDLATPRQFSALIEAFDAAMSQPSLACRAALTVPDRQDRRVCPTRPWRR
jgi:hypothetical protein